MGLIDKVVVRAWDSTFILMSYFEAIFNPKTERFSISNGLFFESHMGIGFQAKGGFIYLN